jgi:putative addiction module component (TIGR02574 family)
MELLKRIETDALQLSQAERAELARVLLLSLEGEEEADHEQLWAEEAERRYEEIRSGEVTALPSSEVLRAARARLK